MKEKIGLLFRNLHEDIKCLFNKKKRIFRKSFKRWLHDNGEEKRLEYGLNTDSTVMDVGGYKGEFTADIVKKFDCTVYVFEPIPEYYQEIKKRFMHNDKVKPFCMALEAESGTREFYLNEDGSSAYRKSDTKRENIVYKSITEFMDEYQINNIDLLEVNIEGGEYALLEKLVDTGYISRVDNLQVQFHNIDNDSEKRMCKIWEMLGKTHSLTWAYRPFIWENWERRS